MKVLSIHFLSVPNTKGQRTVVHVETEDVPLGALKIGVLVWQGERSWRILGVAAGAPRPPTATRIGLALRGEGHDTPPEATELHL